MNSIIKAKPELLYYGGLFMVLEKPNTQKFFNGLNKDTMDLVDEFYDSDVVFEDPMVVFTSREDLKNYYANLYKNVTEIRFEFTGDIKEGDHQTVMWRMHLTAPNFNGGKPVVVDGASHITFGGKEGKAIYHRDYFDMGAFVYENVPVLKNIIGFVKKKMAEQH